ncbi:xylan 1,4-beta-xylosidase [Paenibacillus pectinilyticus]|uniref:Xylan 1,4-beta-xylosidase n=1 Tax=Paenibacillus pectinilyticus TaxID=512399 RepID=A0A1C0ZUT1_9BACL|nr:glycoside hydrolase family 43 protein [Paenibacillus pectinilyticus]OCT11860.1 xylan 1,4-beta-xylosidase [Paenibacillus pectinilyticus]
MKYTNPVISGFYPDPSICRVNEDYYLVNSSFGYFPGVPIFHSRDLINWDQTGHCLTRESQLTLTKKDWNQWNAIGFTGIFAPTLRYHQGRFYMITTNVGASQNFIVWAEQPEGPWSDPIDLDWGGIDPSLLFDEDGKVYITGTATNEESMGIYQAEVDLETGSLLTERRNIWQGTGGRFPEGPHLYRIHNKYYLLIAEGGTEYGHMVTIAKSDEPYGPFESCPHNPILTHRSTESPIQAIGHADLVQAHDGSWWTVFLGIRPVGYPYRHHLGRETFLAPVTWTEEGWPIIGQNGQVALEMEAPSFAQTPQQMDKRSRFVRDDFDAQELGFQWNFLRTPHESSWSLQERPGWLTLYGMEASLNEQDTSSFLGRRQQNFECEVSVLLEFDPVDEGEEAGLTVFMNESAHYEIAVTRMNGKKTLIFRRRIGSLWKVEQEAEYDRSAIVLGIKASKQSYTFSFAQPEGEATEFGKGESSYLSTEAVGGFTGVYFGMYATGNGTRSKTPAYFDYFEYRSL